MSHIHLRSLGYVVGVALFGGGLAAGATQAADPTPRIHDANPAQTHDLSGSVSKAREMRAMPAAPGADMRGVAPDSRAMPMLQPTDSESKAGRAHRTSDKAGGMTVPIGTLNIVRGEQRRVHRSVSLAEQPAPLPNRVIGDGF